MIVEQFVDMRFLNCMCLFCSLDRMCRSFNIMNFERYLFLIDTEFSKLDIAVALHGWRVNLNFLIDLVLHLVYVNLGMS